MSAVRAASREFELRSTNCALAMKEQRVLVRRSAKFEAAASIVFSHRSLVIGCSSPVLNRKATRFKLLTKAIRTPERQLHGLLHMLYYLLLSGRKLFPSHDYETWSLFRRLKSVPR